MFFLKCYLHFQFYDKFENYCGFIKKGFINPFFGREDVAGYACALGFVELNHNRS